MQLIVNGPKGFLTVEGNTVQDIKSKLLINDSNFDLYWNGKILKDNRSLEEYDLSNGSLVDMRYQLKGGQDEENKCFVYQKEGVNPFELALLSIVVSMMGGFLIGIMLYDSIWKIVSNAINWIRRGLALSLETFKEKLGFPITGTIFILGMVVAVYLSMKSIYDYYARFICSEDKRDNYIKNSNWWHAFVVSVPFLVLVILGIVNHYQKKKVSKIIIIILLGVSILGEYFHSITYINSMMENCR